MDHAPYILYLENEQTTNQDVFQALQSSGYNILNVTCHSQSIALIHKHKPTVVLLDLTYSDSCSWDLYRQIKGDKNLRGIPIIDIGKRVPVGGRMIMDDTLHSARDIEHLVRSVKALVPQSKMTMTETYDR